MKSKKSIKDEIKEITGESVKDMGLEEEVEELENQD